MIKASTVPFLFRIKSKFLSWSAEALHGLAFADLAHLIFAPSNSSHILALLELLHTLFSFPREPFPPCLRINLLQGVSYSLWAAYPGFPGVGSLSVLLYPYGIYYIATVRLLACLTPILDLFPVGRN